MDSFSLFSVLKSLTWTLLAFGTLDLLFLATLSSSSILNLSTTSLHVNTSLNEAYTRFLFFFEFSRALIVSADDVEAIAETMASRSILCGLPMSSGVLESSNTL